MLNGVPIAKDDLSCFTAVNSALSVSTNPLLENDWDPEGSSLTASVVDNPAHGTLSSFNSSTGTFTYTPDTSYNGLDSFTYKISDGSDDSNVATVAIAVGGNFGARTNLQENALLAAEACAPKSSVVNLSTSCLTGDVHVAQMLSPSVSLVYNSGTLPRPIVVLETYLQSTSSIPDEIKAQLTFNGSAGTEYSYNTSGLSAGDSLRFALQADANSLATGRYAYTVTLTARFGASNISRNYSGHSLVVNRSSSSYPFGRGWQLAGLDSLVSGSGGMMLVRSASCE